MKLKKKNYKHFQGKVYDLCVANSHSYNVEGLGVHNSGAGSLVAYVLNITQTDPLRYGLLFSRFMRSDQTDYPDIDTDFSRPMGLKDELIEEWGNDAVVPITNWNKLSLKVLLKDISKFYGIPFTKSNEITGKMLFEATPVIKKERGLKAGVVQDPTFDEVYRNSSTLQGFLKEHPEVKTHLENLLGQIKASSRHAGGVILGEKLDEKMPLIYSGGVRQTPWSEGLNVKHLEPLGFIKFDVLGLATLEMFEDTIRNIFRKATGKNPSFAEIREWYNKNLHPDVLDLNDVFVYEHIFHEGRFAGVFQFSENWAQSFVKKAKPKSVVEIATITSLLRPGPMSAGAHTDYLKIQNGQKQPKYYCKEHEELTKETNGFLVFQEQIAQITSTLGKDISLEDGSKLEKLLRKKRQKALELPLVKELRQKFEEGCLEKGMSKKDIDELFQSMVNFAQYGFNKSVLFSQLVSIYDKNGQKLEDKQIKDVKKGDIVCSRDEKTKKDIFVKVKDNHYHGRLKVMEITLDNGEKVKCSINHKFRTTLGTMEPLWKIIEKDLEIETKK